jgi:hypothetical protein
MKNKQIFSLHSFIATFNLATKVIWNNCIEALISNMKKDFGGHD